MRVKAVAARLMQAKVKEEAKFAFRDKANVHDNKE